MLCFNRGEILTAGLKTKICFIWVCLLTATRVGALIAIHDIRYTLYPEGFIADQAEISGGFQTRWIADGDFIGSLKFGINDYFEVGSRITWETENRLEDHYLMWDLGVKAAVSSWQAVQADLLLGINNPRGGGVILTYTTTNAFSKHIAAVYETRLGFLSAAYGDWMSLEIGAHPRIRIADPAVLRIGLAAGSTLRHPIDRFRLDLYPGLELGIAAHLRLFGEFAVNILGEHDQRAAIHIISQF